MIKEKLRSIKNEILMNYCRLLPKEKAIPIVYKKRYNKELNLNNPRTFSEYLQLLIIKKFGEMESNCADKYLVRDYVKKKGYEDILTTLYGNWKNPDDILFESLPQQYVIKATHGCGYNIIVKDKTHSNTNAIKMTLKKWLKEDYSKRYLEYHYDKSKASIIAEEYIGSFDGEDIIDYKFHCIKGNVIGILVCSDRSTGLKLTWFDKKWNSHPENIEKCFQTDKILAKPSKLVEMISIAEKLSEDFEFVRVDLYNIDEKIYFGELTFTPEAGRPDYFTEKLQLELGALFG